MAGMAAERAPAPLAAAAPATTAASGSGNLEVLTFTLGAGSYGIDILKVREIRGYELATSIPNAPPYLKGVAELRGTMVPVIDLRVWLDIGRADYDQFTVVVVVRVDGRLLGMVVDRVSDVLTLAPQQVRPAPDFSGVFDARYLIGLASLDDRNLVLVDLEKLFAGAFLGSAARKQ